MQYKTKATIHRKNPDRWEDIEEDFSTPDEFEEFRNRLGQLDKKKYLELARESMRFKRKYPQYEKGIAYSMCGWGLHLAEIYQDDELFQDVISEFGTLELPDEICSGSWDELEKMIEQAMAQLKTSD